VPNLRVDPTYLDDLRANLAVAQTNVDLAFNAPRGDIGGYPKKLIDSHGATATSGEKAIMEALDSQRAAVQTQLRAYIKACDQALQNAKSMYLAADQEQSVLLSKQIDAGS
jgi:hypothetical protein